MGDHCVWSLRDDKADSEATLVRTEPHKWILGLGEGPEYATIDLTEMELRRLKTAIQDELDQQPA